MEVTMVSLRRRRLLGLCSGKNSCENIACDENSSQNANQMMGAEKVSSPSLQKDEDTTSNSKPGSSNVSGSIPSKEQPSQQNIDAPTLLNDLALETIDLLEASQVSDTEALVDHDNTTTEVDIAMTVVPHNEGITVSGAKDIKDVDTDTASESIYSVDKLEELASKLGAFSHLSSPISVCSSTGPSQNQNAQRISDLMTKLKILVSKDIDSIMSTSGIVDEISLLLKSLDEIRNHLNLAEFGVFTAIQMSVGRFQSDFPNIKLAVSTYHDIHQEQRKAHKNIKELAECLSDVNNEQEELNQQEQQLIDHINVLRRDLKETEEKLTKVRSKKETNATSRKEVESRINQEYPKGTILMGKMTSIEADYNLALAKKKYLAENWANVQNMCNSIS